MWFKVQDQQIRLQIIAKPNAKKTILLRINEEGLHIAIHARPEKGEANKELILFLSDLLGVPKSKIILKSGETSKYKQLIIPFTTKVEKILNDMNLS